MPVAAAPAEPPPPQTPNTTLNIIRNKTPEQVDDASLVEDLLSLPRAGANARAQMYLDMWRFPNTHALGKNLAEKLVAQFHA